MSDDILKHVAGQGAVYIMASQDLPSVEQECSPSFSRNANAPSSTVDFISEADSAVTNLQQIFPSQSTNELAEITRSSSSLEDATNRILDDINSETILLERGTTQIHFTVYLPQECNI